VRFTAWIHDLVIEGYERTLLIATETGGADRRLGW
jgi:hypothetical protein